MKKTLLFVMMITFILCTSCTEKKTPDPIQSNQIILYEIGAFGSIHDSQTSWESLELKDFDLWVLYVKKNVLDRQLNSGEPYLVILNGEDYLFKSNPLNPNILKLLLPSRLKPNYPDSLVIKTADSRENGTIKNDISLAIADIYIINEEKNSTRLNEISIDDYTNLYSAGTENFAYENGQFIRPSHVKSNEENAYEVDTYFDARTVAPTESATSAFQFLKDVNNYEQYIIMENPNRFRVTGGSTDLLPPDDRWRVRQLGNMGPLDGNNVFNIVDDPTNQQFILTIDKEQLPATYTGTYFWETQLKEATVCWFDKTNENNVFETVIAYTDAPGTEIILNSRFQTVAYNAPDVSLKTPVDGTGIGETSVILTWEATPGSRKDTQTVSTREANTLAITHYHVYFATETSDFPEPLQTQEKALQKEGLEYGTNYKWTVEAVQNDTQSASPTPAIFSTSPLSTNTDFQLTGNDPQLIQYESTDPATVLKVASETSVASVLANIVSADGSLQTYIIYNSSPDHPLGNKVELTEAATLLVTSEEGQPYEKEYAIVNSSTPFVSLYSLSSSAVAQRGSSRGYETTWHDTIVDAVASANTAEMSTVTVWPGTYKETITITKSIHLMSTDPTNESIRQTTILDGNASAIVLEIKRPVTSSQRGITQQVIVEGFTITNAMGSSSTSGERPTMEIGAGIIINTVNTVIRNNLITKNGTDTIGGARGIYVKATSQAVTLTKNIIAYNDTGDPSGEVGSKNGAGIFVEWGNPLIHNNFLESNTSGGYGGGICFGSEVSTSMPRVDVQSILYSNSFTNNKALKGGGLFVYNNAGISNGDNDPWKRFNVPNATVAFVEHNDPSSNNNTYSGNSLWRVGSSSRNGEEEGEDIRFEGPIQTDIGTLQIAPATATGNAEEPITMKATITITGYTYDGSITFKLPNECTITTDASVTIGSEAKRALTLQEVQNEQTVQLSGIITETEDQTIVFDFIHKGELSQGTYEFSLTCDADGMGSLYTVSDPATDSLEIPPQYGAPQVAVKSPIDGTEYATTTITFTWEATPGGLINSSSVREEEVIDSYIVAFQNKAGEWASETADNPAEKSHTSTALSYGEDYTWHVQAIGKNGKKTISDPSTFRTTYRLIDLGDEGDVYTTADHDDYYTVSFDRTKLPERYNGMEKFKLTINGSSHLFVQSGDTYTVNIYCYEGSPTLEEIRSGLLEETSTLSVTLTQRKGPIPYGEYNTITDAVSDLFNDAANVAIITLNDTMYQEGKMILLNEMEAEVTFKAAEGVSVVIDGNNSHRLFEIYGSFKIRFQKITFQNGLYEFFSGAITSIDNFSIIIDGCTFDSNSSGSGGGIAIVKSANAGRPDTFEIKNSVISNNTSKGYGGGLLVQNQTESLTGISGIIDNCIISKNKSTNSVYGGGICILTNSVLEIKSASIYENEVIPVQGVGGGIAALWGVTLTTNGNVWVFPSETSIDNNFSVTANGNVYVNDAYHPPKPSHPVQVKNNSASDGVQLYQP